MLIIWTMTLLSALAVAIYAAWTVLFVRNCPVLRPGGPPDDDAPLISIVVPARNEAANIERCVRSLLAQNYPRLEVIAIDDASTDATPEILARLAAEDSRLLVVAGAPLRPGWTGKNNAVAQGVRHAHGEWLLFVDADVCLHQGALSGAYQTATQRGIAMVSLWARQELLSFWERVAQPVIIGVNMVSDPLLLCNSPRFPRMALGNGQFILIDRTVYRRIGGHEAVRDEVVEDQMLSRNVKEAGHRLLMMDGSAVLSTRMYDSLQGVWEGWSKNNFLTLGRSFVVVVVASLCLYLVGIGPFVMALWTLVATKFSQHFFDPLIINLLAIALLFWSRWFSRRFAPVPLRDILWHPVGALVFMGIILNSAYQHTWGRGVTWKGRRYREETAG
ncbi:MAG TPA: glycosyltransferase [Roseiflexaceae bacterium]|nr:glycosyltransferase [Roseiflexaceae bacterium]